MKKTNFSKYFLGKSLPKNECTNDENNNFYARIVVSNEQEKKPYGIHEIIENILKGLKKLLKKNFLMLPAIIKITLHMEVYKDSVPQKIKVRIPRKKCFCIWDLDMIDKVLMKIHCSLIDFHSFIDNPYNLIFKSIEKYEIKVRNLLTCFELTQTYLNSFIENFDEIFEEKFELPPKYLKWKKKSQEITKEEKIKKIFKIKKHSKYCPLPRPTLIYLLEKEYNFNNFESSQTETENTAIGPLHVFQGKDVGSEYDVIFYDSQKNCFLNHEKSDNLQIKEFVCVYCKKILFQETNFLIHYKSCKERFMKDPREKKMKDDIINPPIFVEFPGVVCQKEHLKVFKMIRKPRNQILKNEKKNIKLSMTPTDHENMNDGTQSQASTIFLSDKSGGNDKQNLSKNFFQRFLQQSSFCKDKSNALELKYRFNETQEKFLENNLFTLSKEKNIYLKNVKDYVFHRFNEEIIQNSVNKNLKKFNKMKIHEVYNEFVHNSAIFSYRNETFTRMFFEKPNELVCEYRAKDLLLEVSCFETADLTKEIENYSIENETGRKKIEDLYKKIILVSNEEKKLPFYQRYSYKLLKIQNGIKDQNPYGFFGIIKCDLEYSGEKKKNDEKEIFLNKSQFLKKKFPVLPHNNWLEFRHPNDDNLRCNYKLKKNTFDDLNGYSILSDLLFYLVENDIVEIKRIESVCEFKLFTENEKPQEKIAKTNMLYQNFFKKIKNEFYDFENKAKKAQIFQDKELKQIKTQYFHEVEEVFLQNLFRKDIEKKLFPKDFDLFKKSIPNLKRITNFGPKTFDLTKPKSLDTKIFKIFSFIYMSYLNMKNIDSALGYLLSPKNINNVVLNNSNKKNEKNREIVIKKFTILHISFERMIIKYTCDNPTTKANKIDDLLKKSYDNQIQTYVFSNIIQNYYFMRPYCFYRDFLKINAEKNKKIEKLTAHLTPEFIDFNKEMITNCFLYDTNALNHCKYSNLNLPFKIFNKDCQLYNKLIFDEGFESKNDKTIKLMIHNLETRFRVENPSAPLTFKHFFKCKPKDLKEFIFKYMDYGMNLDNYGTKWNLDHIIPINSAKDQKEKNEIIWRLENLKPMKIEENVKKGCKILNLEAASFVKKIEF